MLFFQLNQIIDTLYSIWNKIKDVQIKFRKVLLYLGTVTTNLLKTIFLEVDSHNSLLITFFKWLTKLLCRWWLLYRGYKELTLKIITNNSINLKTPAELKLTAGWNFYRQLNKFDFYHGGEFHHKLTKFIHFDSMISCPKRAS